MQSGNKYYENKFEHNNGILDIDYNNIKLISERLIIKTIDKHNKIDLLNNYNSETSKYLYYKSCETDIDAENIINKSIQGMELGNRIVFTLNDKITNDFVGCFGIFKLDTNTPEVGFVWVKSSETGKGFITEAAFEILKWFCQTAKFNYIYCFVDERNISGINRLKEWGGIIGEKLPPMKSQENGRLLHIVEFRLYRQHLINFLLV